MHVDAGSMYCLEGLELNPVTNFILGGCVEASHFIVAAPWEILQVADIIPTWPIERQGLAFDGVGSWRQNQGMQKDCRGQPFYIYRMGWIDSLVGIVRSTVCRMIVCLIMFKLITLD